MIEASVLQRTLQTALRHGGDFAEVFAEDRRSASARLDDAKVEEFVSGRERGAGIRVVQAGQQHDQFIAAPSRHRITLAHGLPEAVGQGDEDLVVPPNQTEMMVEALRAKGLPVGYLLFAGEQHGFRQAANIKRALDAELYFYAANVFNVTLAF